MYANVGCQGRISDGGVFSNTVFARALNNGTLNLPPPQPLPGRQKVMPYVCVGDDAFPLSENLMKPFPGEHDKGSGERAFNYRLSRARRVVENVFGILSAAFRVFDKPIPLSPDKAKTVTMACVHLHNFLRKSESSRRAYNPPGTYDMEDVDNAVIIDGSWRVHSSDTAVRDYVDHTPCDTDNGHAIRQEFKEYVISNIGRVPWQDRCA